MRSAWNSMGAVDRALAIVIVLFLLAVLCYAWAESRRYDAGDLLRDMGDAAVEATKEREAEEVQRLRVEMSWRRAIEAVAEEELQKKDDR